MKMQMKMKSNGHVTDLKTLNDLPTPPGFPLVGNMLRLDSSERHHLLDEWVGEYGSMYRFRQGPKKNIVVITDADLQNEVLLERPGRFRRMSTIETVFDEMGIGCVFSAEGDYWRAQRKVVNQMLGLKYQRLFLPTLTHHVTRLQAHWEKAAEQNLAVDVHHDLLRISLDVIVAFIFGQDINSRQNRGEEIHQLLGDIFVTLSRRIHSITPYWRYVKLPVDREVVGTVSQMVAILHEFVAVARQRMSDQPELAEKPTNYLEAILAEKDETDRPKYSDKEIVGNVLIMLLAGEDAIADVLTWTMYNICAYPEIQQKLQEEVAAAQEIEPNLETMEAIDALKFTDAVVSETLRMHPADHALFMETDEDVELGGYLIPKGTVIFLLIRFSMQDDDNFGLGTEFHPERWLAARNCPFHGAHNRKAFVPFGNGPRGCPGRTLSYLEMKRIVAMICHNFDIQFADGPPTMTEEWGILMTPRGLSVRFTRRQPVEEGVLAAVSAK